MLRKPKMGLLLFGAERFCSLGEGTARGTYLERKEKDALRMRADAEGIADVTFTGIVFTRDDAVRAMDAFVISKVDFVLAIYLSWAEDYAWNRFLRDMPPVPVLFAHCMREEISLKDTHDPDEFTEYLCCGGLVGMLEASGNNVNYARPMLETYAGTWPEVLERASTFGNAARARALLRGATVGLLASFNEAMWSTYVNPYDVFARMGPELRFLSIAELTDTIELIPESDAERVMNGIAEKYEVLPGVQKDKFLASVRASMAMELMAEKYGLDLLVLNDIDTMLFRKVGLRPGFYPTRRETSAIIVPEGDIGGGLAVYILHLLTDRPVHFIEPFHVDLKSDTFAGGHAGPNDYTDPAGKTKISVDVRFAASKWKHAGAPFAWHVFSSGQKSMLHISQHGGEFLLAGTLIDSLPTDHFLATYSHGVFRPVGQSCRQLFEKLLRLGVTQHYGIVSGDCLDAVSDLAMMLNIPYHSV